MIIVSLPKPNNYLKKRIFPVEKFYKLIAKKVDPQIDTNKFQIDVTKVRINPANSKEFKTVVKQYIKNKYPYLSKKQIELEVGMVWLMFGPVEDKNIPVDKCGVDKENLFISRT